MQTFYKQIFSTPGPKGIYQACLVELTQASLGQMKALEGAPAWSTWGEPI